jgi:uncharacterized protein YqgV (UPF0045/DUF77 family)
VNVSAQVSLYPLRQERLSPALEVLRRALEREGLAAQVGPMSTLVTGEAGRVFAALQVGFEQAAAGGSVVRWSPCRMPAANESRVPSIWELFERAAEDYAAWYATPGGGRAYRAEEELLGRLLAPFPEAHSVLEVGCGTGQFTAWLAGRGLRTLGLDRAPAMLAQLRARVPGCTALLADAHALPLLDRAVDLVMFVTTLEFLDAPQRALAEGRRRARRAADVTWGISRRIGSR